MRRYSKPATPARHALALNATSGTIASKQVVILREVLMSERGFTIPEIILLAGTRIALGAGLGLLLAGKLSSDARKGAGWALLAVGAVTTIPLVVSVVSKPQLAGKRADLSARCCSAPKLVLNKKYTAAVIIVRVGEANGWSTTRPAAGLSSPEPMKGYGLQPTLNLAPAHTPSCCRRRLML
jgi:hypothetical protein